MVHLPAVQVTVDIIAHSKVSDNSEGIVPSFPIRASYGRMRAAGGAKLCLGRAKHEENSYNAKSGGVLSRWAEPVEASSKGGTYVV